MITAHQLAARLGLDPTDPTVLATCQDMADQLNTAAAEPRLQCHQCTWHGSENQASHFHDGVCCPVCGQHLTIPQS